MRISLALGLLLLAVAPAPASAQSRIYGDCALPEDNTINVLDGLQSGRYSVGLDILPSPGSPDFVACDVDADADLTVLDNLAISRFSVGLSVAAPVGVPIPNQPPLADAGGPYTSTAGGGVSLTGAGSSDDFPPLASFEWDLDADGSYETLGETVLFSCPAEGSYPVTLRVTDGFGLQSTDATSVSCLAAADLFVQWTDSVGVPLSSVAVGSTVYLEVCTPLSQTQAFQADVGFSGPLTRTGSGSDLNAATAQGACGDPSSSDGVNQYVATAPPANPFNFQNYSVQASPGTGTVGLARIPFSADAPGEVSVSLTVQIWQLFSGSAPTSPQVQIAPLTVF